ncbi:copper-binding protein [Acuticoccus kandeliae]|uniref:copper-binding protein n=1 Tax=Acuticoccus kandeliae TaxID=2073160 RepID=UPI001FE9EADC|nr:copper-binding protein [Acuticoccus kandeliae]
MMKLPIYAALVASLVFAAPAAHADATKGEVTKVDTRRNRVTIKHGPIVNLDMPAMTMVFEVADPAMLEKMPVGKSITFNVDRIEGKLTIIEVE